jgi:hypothetical protein
VPPPWKYPCRPTELDSSVALKGRFGRDTASYSPERRGRQRIYLYMYPSNPPPAEESYRTAGAAPGHNVIGGAMRCCSNHAVMGAQRREPFGQAATVPDG